jgi:hypothetical protein
LIVSCHVPHGQHDVHLGRLQRADRPGRLVRVGGGEQLVRDDGQVRRLPGLGGQDVPFPGPRPGRVAGQLLDAAQVLAGPEVILGVVAGQHQALGGQSGAVAPHHLLQEGGAGLRLADVQENPAVRCHPGTLSVVGEPVARPG